MNATPFRSGLRAAALVAALALLLPLTVPAVAHGGQQNEPLLLDKPTNPVPALDFAGRTLDGDTVRLADLAGKVVFINFWATWCTPCLLEMPSMERLQAAMKGRPFRILAVNVREAEKDVRTFVEEQGFSFTVLLDPKGEISDDYAVRNLPLTYIVDRKGRVIRRAIGNREWDSPEAVALFERLAAGQPPDGELPAAPTAAARWNRAR